MGLFSYDKMEANWVGWKLGYLGILFLFNWKIKFLIKNGKIEEIIIININ